MPARNNFRKYSIYFRLREGLSQAELAELVGCTEQQVALWERGGTVEVDKLVVERFAAHCGCSPNEKLRFFKYFEKAKFDLSVFGGEFGDLVALLRKRVGLTQLELSREFGFECSDKRISHWECGDTVPKHIDEVRKLAEILICSYEEKKKLIDLFVIAYLNKGGISGLSVNVPHDIV